MNETVSSPEAGLAELAALDAELESLHMEGHWKLPHSVTDRAPEPFARPHLWRWANIRRLLTAAGDCRAIEGGTGRRTVRLCTPGLPLKWATPTIHASVQLVKPGEIAEAHRHTMTAFRFVVEGHGGYTTVDGEKFSMEAGDMILTPHSSWHDHGHDGGAPLIWIDGHDFPFAQHINALFFESFGKAQQDVSNDGEAARRLFSGLRPHGFESPAAGVPFNYKGRETLQLLRRLGDDARDPNGAIALDYVNPVTGKSMLPTIGARLLRLRQKEKTLDYRHTPSNVYHVVQGSGTTVAGEMRLEWSTGDIFVIPGWTWQHHRANDDAILLDISDRPIYDAFALLLSEQREN